MASSTGVVTAVQEVLTKMFSAAYICDPYHSEWRKMVSPLTGTVEHTLLKVGPGAIPEPPVVSLQKLVEISAVASALNGSEGAGAEGADVCPVSVVKEAVSRMSGVATLSDAGVSRVELVKDSENPQGRFVVVKPLNIPEGGDRDELVNSVKSIFARFGKIVSVDLQRWGTVLGAEIEFSTFEEASRCVGERSMYSGSEEVRAAFLPPSDATRKLQVFSKPQFQLLQQEIVANQQNEWAKKRIAEAETERKLGEESGVSFVSSRRYTPGTLVVVRNRPEKYGWDVIKTKLTNLFPSESHLIHLVKDQDSDTFVFTRTPQDVSRLLEAYKAAVAEEATAASLPPPPPVEGRPARKPKTPLCVVVPSLEKASTDEEEYIRQLYPVWMSGAVTKKIGTNILHKAGTKRGRY